MESQQSQDSSRQFLSFQSLLEQPQSHNMGGICPSAGNTVGRVDRRASKQHTPLRFQPYRMQAGCSQQQQQELLTATHHAQASTHSQQQHQEQQRLLALLLQQSPPPAAQPTTSLAQQQPQQQQPLHAQERIIFRRELALLLNGMTFQQAAYLKELLRQHLQLAQQDRQQQQQQGRAVLCRVRCLQLMQLYSAELKAGRFQIPGQQRAPQLLQLQQQQGAVGRVLEVVPAGPLCAWLDRECEIRQLSRLYARLAAAAAEAGAQQQQQQQQWVPLLRQSQLAAFVGQLLRQKTGQQAASLTESVLAAESGPQLGRTGSVLQHLLQGQPGTPPQQEVLPARQHLAAARARLQEPEPTAGSTLDQLMAEALAICRDPNSTLGEIVLGMSAALEEGVRVERACTKVAGAAAAAAVTDAELDLWAEVAAAAATDRGAALAILQHPQLRQAASMQRHSLWQMAAAPAVSECGSCSVEGDVEDSADTAGCK